VTFIGVTLWTDFKNRDFFVMQNSKTCINDFQVIKNGKDSKKNYKKFSPEDAAQKHNEEKAYLNSMIEQNRGKKIVIITHFLPSYQLIHPRWKTSSTDDLNYYFSASCDDLVRKSGTACWAFGHTHDKRDMMLGNVRCVCNPVGYKHENLNYTDLVITI
jgi:hypothetical protein